jgi:hypothetical protein
MCLIIPSMDQLKYTGSVANVQLLSEELRQDSEVAEYCTIAVLEQERNKDSLHNAELAQVVISIISGVATKFTIDAIQAAVDRARDRGPITADESDVADTEKQEAAGTHDIGNPPQP